MEAAQAAAYGACGGDSCDEFTFDSAMKINALDCASIVPIPFAARWLI